MIIQRVVSTTKGVCLMNKFCGEGFTASSRQMCIPKTQVVGRRFTSRALIPPKISTNMPFIGAQQRFSSSSTGCKFGSMSENKTTLHSSRKEVHSPRGAGVVGASNGRDRGAVCRPPPPVAPRLASLARRQHRSQEARIGGGGEGRGGPGN